jgi:YfiH family protein
LGSFVQAGLWAGKEKTLGISHGFFKGKPANLSSVHSCNISFDRGDPYDLVKQKRKEIEKYSGTVKKQFFANQSHTNQVLTVNGDDDIAAREMPVCDALVTSSPQIQLGIGTADCVPVLLFASAPRVIGAAHCGWKGLQKGLLDETIHSMSRLGVVSEKISVAVGPCIHVKNYKVEEDFVKNFPGYEDFFFEIDGGLHADLPGIAKNQLRKSGIKDIEDVNIDTYEDTEFFSHRRSIETNQITTRCQASVIMLLF